MKRHEFTPELTWDESALVCRRCDQFDGGWMHDMRPWWKRIFRKVK